MILRIVPEQTSGQTRGITNRTMKGMKVTEKGIEVK